MKNKKRILLLSLIVTFVALVLSALCTSCSFFGLFGGDEDVVPVTVDSITVLKTATDYTSSVEYEYNKDKNNSMALQSGEDFYLQITYNNPKKYAISYITVTPEGENAMRITNKEFDAKSTKTKTVIRFSIPATNVSNEVHNYIIKKIYYVTGNDTIAVKFEKEFKTEFSVIVNPTYTLELNYQNTDRRSGSLKTEDDKTTTANVSYGADMTSLGVLSKDYANPDSLPSKAGGWKFEGWYTEPHGKGICVGSNDKYFFWGNVTLYADYSRLFEYEIVDLDEPIVHEYVTTSGGSASVNTRTFSKGVVITGDATAGKYPYLDIYDTIVDETVQESGYVYAVEYPVVKVANEAFKDVNNITTLSIGSHVTEIGYKAFDNCNKLAKVTFSTSSSLKYLGDFAFQNTKAMGITNAFTLPDTVEYIGNFCFRYSGWSLTNNNGINESVLHIYPRYTFLGVAAFFETGFSKIVFEPGCHFESQIGYDEGREMEKNYSWKEIHYGTNRIGMNLFGCNRNLEDVEFLSDDPDNNALNIIPDRCFDAGNYKNMKLLGRVVFAEGLEFVGDEAFNYQEKITYLDLPASLKEVGRSAFYNNISVASLTFREGSLLTVLHRRCFGNLASIDRVEIISSQLMRYGDGPFEGCGRLKSIEFPNINDVDLVPVPFDKNENAAEVNTTTRHYYADLMFGTFETGSDASDDEEGTSGGQQQQSGYSLPTRIFCKAGTENVILNKFRDTIITGKDTFYNNDKTYHSGEYNNVVFVHDIDLIRQYENPTALQGEEPEVDIALQEVYDANSGAVLGYSIVYWAQRSKVITLPSSFPGMKHANGKIIELSMYSMPTSVTEITIPATITRLEHDALNGCVNLEKINYENKDTLTYIGDYAFFGTKISSFEGGAALKVIGENAFMRCTALKWVDLMDTSITNPFKIGSNNPRIVHVQQYKYEYELKKNGKDRTDHYDVLYDGAFRGCSSLKWVALPLGLKQVPEGLFTGCRSLRYVIIPCKGVSQVNSPTADDTFYYRALPTAIYDSDAVPYMTIYVPGSELSIHETIFARSYGVTYALLSDDYSNIPSREG